MVEGESQNENKKLLLIIGKPQRHLGEVWGR
jgi:hypothetical protein